MNKTQISATVVLLAVTLVGCKEPADSESGTAAAPGGVDAVAGLETEEQKVSYIMGMNIGSQIDTESFEFDMATFNLGVSDAFSGAEPRLSEEQVKTVIEGFQAKMAAKQEAAAKIAAEANLKEGEAFLAKNAETDGVVVLESGLQYKIIEAGTGAIPTAENTVEVHYKGTLIDGTEFDSSYKRGVPAQFGVTQVIPGWVEALQLMKEGAKWELYVPPSLAYGPGGTGGAIGPNQTLIFEVELLKASVAEASAESP